MARRVLVSFLGTGPYTKGENTREYRKTLYKFDNFEMETPFIAVAVAEKEQIDSFILLGTMKSMWEAVYEYFSFSGFDEGYYWELAESGDISSSERVPEKDIFSRLENALGNDSKIIPLFYGLNKQQLDYNLKKILGLEKYLRDGDELFIDITHSFRSLPVFITTALFYLKDVSSKNIKIKGIYYGMADLYSELNYAPVVKLDSILETIDWIKGAYSFKEFGNAYLISEKLEADDKSMAAKLKRFTNAKNLNLLNAMKTQIRDLKSLKFDKLKSFASLIVPSTINNFTKNFKDTEKQSDFQLNLAEWHLKNRNYSSALLVFVEALITYVCERENIDWSVKENRATAKGKIIYDRLYTKVKSVYIPINDIRKAVAHSVEVEKNAEQAVASLKNAIKEFKNIK